MELSYRSLDNQCWRLNNFLLDEEKFKLLVHSEGGVPWLASTDQEMSQLVEDVTKSGGLYPDERFTILTSISVQCQGGDRWNVSTTDGAASWLEVKEHLHRSVLSSKLAGALTLGVLRLPCLSTEFCPALPSLGDFIRTSTVTGGEPWQRKLSSLSCQKEEHFFHLPSLDYPASLEARCVPKLLFGGNFPYWEIPGLNYPTTTQLVCLSPKVCRDFSQLSGKMDSRGFMDNFDQVNAAVGDTFQYFCNMEGRRGG